MLNRLKKLSLKHIINVFTFFIIAVTVVCALAFTLIYTQSNTFSTAWSKFEKGSQQKREILSDLQKYLGYGGMIHNFKNYVLRGDEKYFNKTIQQSNKVKYDIRIYMTLSPSADEADYLETIRQVAERYALAARTSKKLLNENKSIRQIDKAVKINDKPAIKAFNQLNAYLNSANTFEKNKVNKLLGSILVYSLIGTIIVILGMLTITLMTLFVGHKLIVKPILAASQSADEISKGNYVISDDITGFKEADILKQSFTKMTTLVQEEINKVKLQLKSEIQESNDTASLSESLAGKSKLNDLTKFITSSLAKITSAQCVALYLLKNENNKSSLILESTFSCEKQEGVQSEFALGEGLVGQCAIDKEPTILNDIPDDYMHVKSALGSKDPTSIIIFPILHNNEVLAIIELASLSKFNEKNIKFLKRISDTISLNINNSNNLEKLSMTLEKSQNLNDELNAQQEELRSANEKLVSQKKELQESEEELQSQGEELRVINEELEEKTNDLEQQKKSLESMSKDLEQRAKDLALSSKYKSEFLANMSHELRTPLNSLLILSKKLADNREENLTEKQVKSAEIIHNGGQELLTLINDILDLSKVEAGKLQIDVIPCQINDLCNKLKDQFEPVANEKSLSFNLEIDKNIPDEFMSDPQRVTQIIRNFISNATKFTAEGSITLRVHRPEKEVLIQGKKVAPNDLIGWSVIDTGIGIPKDKQHLIFEAFQQAEGSTSRKYGGTGLGLAISQAMAELLGGDVSLESEEGKGSTFTLYTPNSIEKNVSESDENTIEEKKPEEVEQSSGESKQKTVHQQTLLVVEDDNVFSKVVSEFATEKNYTVLRAENGKEALLKAEGEKPDAIILDLGLPDIDGTEVLKKLKNNPATMHIPVHVISGRDNEENIERSDTIGFLKKPASLDALNDVFDKIRSAIKSDLNNILIIDDADNEISELVSQASNATHTEKNGESALNYLNDNTVDCIVLNSNLHDMPSIDFLKRLNDKIESMPFIIIYTDEELSKEQHDELRRYTSSIIIKGQQSATRLKDELSLFLNKVEEKTLGKNKRNIEMLNSGDEILNAKKVLLVDDDMRNVFALSSELEDFNMEVIIASDGQQAIDKLAEHSDIDIVLMDIMMPVMDGYTAIKNIRKNKQFSNLPIITLTAKAMPSDKEKSINSGANDYITKPINIDHLVSVMKIWLSK